MSLVWFGGELLKLSLTHCLLTFFPNVPVYFGCDHISFVTFLHSCLVIDITALPIFIPCCLYICTQKNVDFILPPTALDVLNQPSYRSLNPSSCLVVCCYSVALWLTLSLSLSLSLSPAPTSCLSLSLFLFPPFSHIWSHTQLLVFIVSEEAAKSSVCQDQVSLAYISNKPIIVAARNKKTELIKDFGVGMWVPNVTISGDTKCDLSWLSQA